MQYKEFKDGVQLSRLGMGAMRLPVKGDDSQIDYERQLEEQLRRLKMDRIDFYLLHGIQDSFVDDILASGCVEYFDRLKTEGKIRYLGFSFHGSPETLKKAIQYYPWDFVQMQLNYYDWYCGNAEEIYRILEDARIPVMVMEPVHGGLLADLTEDAIAVLKNLDPECSQASWAMRWVMSRKQVQVVLSGMSDQAQLADNVKTFSEGRTLNEDEESALKEAAQIQYRKVAVPCTSCRYCTPNCPMDLDIPVLLRAYNEAKIGGEWRLTGLTALPKEKLPENCIGCGACTQHCPQSFDIPGYMRELKEMIERLAG